MKILFHNYLALMLIISGILIPPTDLNAGVSFGGIGPTFAPTTTAPAFSRTFRAGTTGRNHDWCQDERRAAQSAVPGGPDKSLSLAITFADFQAHLGQGQDRTILEISRAAGIPMDVGAEGVEDGNWVLPDFSAFPPVMGSTIFSQEVASSPYPEDYPDATHVFYSPGAEQYEYFELFEDDGSGNGVLFYFGASDANFIYEANRVMAPVPMQLGLGVFGGDDAPIDCADLEGGCADIPDASYIISSHYYEEVASGTLNTFDAGAAEAFKLRHTEEIVVYDVDDFPIETFYNDEIIFYSRAGHYVIAELEEGAPWEGMTSFTKITYHKVAAAALPVEWLGVTARLDEKQKTVISWSTQSETESDRFIVERSQDGAAFTAIGEVVASGNSSTVINYDFIDETPESGTNYYRIRQRDFSGAESFSDIVTVFLLQSADEAGSKLLVYPNPGYNEVFFSQPTDYELFSSNGQLLSSGRADRVVNVEGLPPGVYGIRLDGGEVSKWIKMK